MNVTKQNWHEAFPLFLAKVQSESLQFVSFDLEMTGIGFAGESFNDAHDYNDDVEDRYSKVARVASSFAICQLGVALFAASCEKAGGLECSVFNFEVFDASHDQLVSPSALSFLVGNGFDLNRWVTCGIPLVNAEEEEKLREDHAQRLAALNEEMDERRALEQPSAVALTAEQGASAAEPEAKRARGADSRVVLDRPADQEAARVAIATLKAWAAALPAPHDGAMVEGGDGGGTCAEVVLGPFAWAGLRKYIYQEIETDPELCGLRLVTEKRGRDAIAVMAPTPAQRAARAVAKRAALESDLSLRLGARAVFSAMAEACQSGAVPLVGHNCLADLCFLFATFDDELPVSVDEFRTRVAVHFPRIVDTKYAATYGANEKWWAPLGSSSLEGLINQFDAPQVPPRPEPAPGDAGGTEGGCGAGAAPVGPCKGLCGFLAHSDPPKHFGEADAGYCCSKCRLATGGHGGNCQRAPTNPSEGGGGAAAPPARIPITIEAPPGAVQAGSGVLHGADKYHEAGWDAACTGRIFVRFAELADRAAAGQRGGASHVAAGGTMGDDGDGDAGGAGAGGEGAGAAGAGEAEEGAAAVVPWAALPVNVLNLMRSPYALNLEPGGDELAAPGERAAAEVARRAARDEAEALDAATANAQAAFGASVGLGRSSDDGGGGGGGGGGSGDGGSGDAGAALAQGLAVGLLDGLASGEGERGGAMGQLLLMGARIGARAALVTAAAEAGTEGPEADRSAATRKRKM